MSGFIYYIVIFLIFILRLLFNGKKYNKVYLFCCLIVLLSVSSLRGYSVGGDLYYYLPLFEEISKYSSDQLINTYDKYGVVFKTFFYICSFITSHPSFFLFCESCFVLLIIFKFIRQTSHNYMLSLFLFVTFGFYTNTFNSIRSSFALCLAVLGVLYIIKDKRKLAFLMFLIAFEIHKTIAPIFLLLLLKNYHLTLKQITIAIVTSFAISRLIGISNLVPIILLYDSNYAMFDDFSGSGYSLLLLDVLMTYTCFFFSKNSNNKTNEIMLFCLVIASCLQTFAPVFNLFTRMAYFFMFYMIILIPNIITSEFNKKSYRILSVALITGSLLYFEMIIMTPSPITHTNSQATIPYYFFWEQKPRL